MTLLRPTAIHRDGNVYWRGTDLTWVFCDQPEKRLAHFKSSACGLPESLRDAFVADLEAAIRDADNYEPEQESEAA